jgi:hypothetical protein
MKNKAYIVKRLCELRGLDPESEEAQGLYSLKVVELLTEIKKSTPVAKVVPAPVQEDEDEELPSLAQRLGCT